MDAFPFLDRPLPSSEVSTDAHAIQHEDAELCRVVLLPRPSPSREMQPQRLHEVYSRAGGDVLQKAWRWHMSSINHCKNGTHGRIHVSKVVWVLKDYPAQALVKAAPLRQNTDTITASGRRLYTVCFLTSTALGRRV